MLKIRLQRIGRKNEPSFRLVVTESQNSTKSGKSLEVLGSHDFRKTNTILHKDRIVYWMSKGAQVSDTAHNLLVSNKIINDKKRNVLPKKTYTAPVVEEVKVEAPKVEAPKAEEPAAKVEETVVEAPQEEAPAVVEEVAPVEEAK